jgi:hypothetical protein
MPDDHAAEPPTGQRKGRAIAMTAAERDAFLRGQPVCRVATVGADGAPHLSALWFVWDGTALWLNSLTRSQRWTDIGRDARLAVVVDDGGADFLSLCGIELQGRAEIVGEVPRKGEPHDELPPVERMFADKYAGGRDFSHDGRHAWLRLAPERVVSWDFRKLRR